MIKSTAKSPTEILIVAVPESAGSALYGMVDVLSAAGTIWQTLARAEAAQALFKVSIVSPDGVPFVCGNGIPVTPALSIADDSSLPRQRKTLPRRPFLCPVACS